MQDKAMNTSLKLLLDIAKEMIQEKGCRATTLQEIADRSGLTKGAIYHYFKSKDELFARILEEAVENTNQLFLAAVSKPEGAGGLVEPLRLFSGKLHHLSQEDSVSNQIFVYLLSQKDKPAVERILEQYYETSIRLSKAWIEIGQRDGVIPAGLDAQKVAQLFALFKTGLQVQHIVVPQAVVMDEHDIFTFMLNALS